MKIAITGGTAGIGLALAKLFEESKHELIVLSRRNGYNIRSLPKIAGMIEPCDMFINNYLNNKPIQQDIKITEKQTITPKDLQTIT